MEGIVKGKNRAYARYEEALLRRDGLRREADNLHLEYIRLFGDLIEQSFRLKIESKPAVLPLFSFGNRSVFSRLCPLALK